MNVLVDGRWELCERLGSGGQGHVYRVVDRHSGREAALKVIRVTAETQRARLRREIQALRTLQVSGVVPLLDVGEHEGAPYLVMELVEGAPFPGVGVDRGWRAIVSRMAAMLGILAQVHAAGIIHRDLKPDNVLVDERGRVTLLDFGLARGDALTATVTMAGGWPVGTPRYLAPEQAFGHRVDGRADLYALGVMVFEALTGRPPLPDGGFLARLSPRSWPSPPRLAELRPDLDDGACALVDRLLCRDPEARFPTAVAALAALQELAAVDTLSRPPRLPLLGREAALQELLTDARSGVARDVWGPPGSGRTRVLREACEALLRSEAEVLWLEPSPRPLPSLALQLGPEDAPPQSLPAIAARLKERLQAGLVLFVDDPGGLGARVAELLDEARRWGAVIRVADTPGALLLGPIEEELLRGLFHGPDRVLHLREDGAAQLQARTGGLPARIVPELDAWVGAGLCRWDEGLLRIERASLDRLLGGLRVGGLGTWGMGRGHELEPTQADLLVWLVLAGGALDEAGLAAVSAVPAWELGLHLGDLAAAGLLRRRPDGGLEALFAPHLVHELTEDEVVARHRALAMALPEGSEARLRQWLYVGEPGRVVETLGTLGAMVADGQPQRARALLVNVLQAVRGAGELPDPAVIRALVAATMAEQTVDGCAAAAGALEWVAGAYAEQLRAVVRGYGALLAGRPQEAAAIVAVIPPFAHPDDDIFRRHARYAVAVPLRNEDPHALIDDVLDHPDWTAHRPRLLAWRGRVFYDEERFAEAVDAYRAALALPCTTMVRMAVLANLAATLVELDTPEDAEPIAAELAEYGSRLRLPSIEAQAITLSRSARYRAGGLPDEDPDWLPVSRKAGELHRHAFACLTEAAIAWRCSRPGDCAELAAESADGYRRVGRPDLAALPHALRCVVTADHTAPPTAGGDLRVRRFGQQVEVLLGRAGAGLREPDAPAVGTRLRWDVLCQSTLPGPPATELP